MLGVFSSKRSAKTSALAADVESPLCWMATSTFTCGPARTPLLPALPPLLLLLLAVPAGGGRGVARGWANHWKAINEGWTATHPR